MTGSAGASFAERLLDDLDQLDRHVLRGEVLGQGNDDAQDSMMHDETGWLD